MNKIMWPRAKYWTEAFNPWVGCRKCSPACEHCYAEEFIKRFNMTGVECNGSFDPVRKDKCKTPKSGIVFAGNITDLFGEWVKGSESRQYVLDAAQAANGKKWCKYLFLTKRVRRMNELTKELGCYTFAKHYENVWFAEFDPESNKPIDEQPAVVAHNALWPNCPNLGDMTKID